METVSNGKQTITKGAWLPAHRGEGQKVEAAKPKFYIPNDKDDSGNAGWNIGVTINKMDEEDLPGIFRKATSSDQFGIWFGKAISQMVGRVTVPGFYPKLIHAIEEDTFSRFAVYAASHLGKCFHGLSEKEREACIRSITTKSQMNDSPFVKQFTPLMLHSSFARLDKGSQVWLLQVIEDNPKSTFSKVALSDHMHDRGGLKEDTIIWLINHLAERRNSPLIGVFTRSMSRDFRGFFASRVQEMLRAELRDRPGTPLARALTKLAGEGVQLLRNQPAKEPANVSA